MNYDWRVPVDLYALRLKAAVLAGQDDEFARQAAEAANWGLTVPVDPSPKTQLLALYAFAPAQITVGDFGTLNGLGLRIEITEQVGRFDHGANQGPMSIRMWGCTHDHSDQQAAWLAAGLYAATLYQIALVAVASDQPFYRDQAGGESASDYAEYRRNAPRFEATAVRPRHGWSADRPLAGEFEVVISGTLVVQERRTP